MHLWSAVLAVAVATGAVAATPLTGLFQDQNSAPDELVSALRRGGQVIVMRHASSPRTPPDRQAANADNIDRERQLDAEGRAGATAMGEALRGLKVPISEVLTSPTYRAMETVRLAQLPNPQTHAELGDGGQSMHGVTEAHAAWLRDRAARRPAGGGNVIIVTHMPNLVRAFPAWGSTVADGEAVILRPDGRGTSSILGRVKIREWSRLAK